MAPLPRPLGFIARINEFVVPEYENVCRNLSSFLKEKRFKGSPQNIRSM